MFFYENQRRLSSSVWAVFRLKLIELDALRKLETAFIWDDFVRQQHWKKTNKKTEALSSEQLLRQIGTDVLLRKAVATFIFSLTSILVKINTDALLRIPERLSSSLWATSSLAKLAQMC